MQRPQAKTRFGLRAVAGVLTVVLCGASGAAAQEQQLPRTDLERVAFVTRVPPADGAQPQAVLDVMRSDGTDRSTVAGPQERVEYHNVQWSPDGRYIAAARSGWDEVGTFSAVVVIPAAGGEPHVLDDAGQSPSWSADGRRIAWARPHEGSLVVVDVISTVPELILGEPRVIPVGQQSGYPRLSPDGQRLLFRRAGVVDHRWELWTVAVDSGEPQRLTATPVRATQEDSTYAWSPTGAQISFIAVDPEGYARPRLIDADGANERLLLGDACDHHFLVWAPSGDYLALDAGCSPYAGLILVDLQGQRLRTLVPDAFQDWRRLVFAPDGSALYIVTQEGTPGVLSPDRGRNDVYRIPVDGGPFLRLTFDGSAGSELAFYGPHVVLPGSGLPVPPVVAPPPVPELVLPPPPDDLPPLPGTVEPPGGRGSLPQACPEGEVPQHPFSDLPDHNVHLPSVACMAWWKVVRGVTPTRYEPRGHTTRAQMASLLVRLILEAGGTLPPGSTDYFLDDAGSVHEDNINRLAAVGVIRGRSGQLYYPYSSVQRDQMASFVLAAYEHLTAGPLPEPRRDYFIDDGRSVHERRINQAAEAALVAGIDAVRYAPARPEQRDQAATRSARVADLLVDQGTAAPPK